MNVVEERERTENRVTGSHPPRIRPRQSAGQSRRAARENHTQRKFVPAAMYFSLTMRSQWKSPRPEPPLKPGGRARHHRPGTHLLNTSNVKRKPAARGRMRHD
jgi:hypothetical protein